LRYPAAAPIGCHAFNTCCVAGVDVAAVLAQDER
jgi:hypothetical protein